MSAAASAPPAPPDDAPEAPRRTDCLVAGGLVVLTLACSWGIAAAAGTIDVPRTDDWGFARVAFDLHRTGHLHLINWGPMTIVAHLFWAQPFLWLFGDHRWALSLSTSVLVAVGLVAAYSLARLRLGVAAAATTVMVLLAFPGVTRDAATYMSDPAALGLQLTTLTFGAHALRSSGRRRTILFAAAMVTGFWAFGIRELAAAAPLAVLATALLAARTMRGRRRVVLGGAVFGAACMALWVWHHNLPGVERYGEGPSPGASTAIIIVSATLTLGLALAPAVAWSLPRWWRTGHAWGRAIGAVCGIALVAARPLLAHRVHAHNWWLVGDYLQADGINGGKMLLGYRPIVLDSALWHVLLGIAAVSTTVCAALLGEWVAGWLSGSARRAWTAGDPVARLIGWHVFLSAATLIVAATWNGVLFDRYLWPLVFSGALLLIGRTPLSPSPAPARVGAVSQVLGVCAIVVALGTAALLTINSAAFDSARWKAASSIAAGGVPADEIDGGVEWDGAHSTVPNGSTTPVIRDPLVAWWTAMTRMERICVVVTASPIDSPLGEEISTVHWRPLLFTGDATLHIYRLHAPACA